MCGRFALNVTKEILQTHFSVREHFHMVPRYNIAPSQVLWAVRESSRDVAFMRWGFIPTWASAKENKAPMAHINARFETVLEKPTFKRAFVSRRCIVAASGYFEWKSVAKRKQPYYISVEGQPVFGMAGIWETWQDHNGNRVEGCAILTQNACEPLSNIHDRMPCILSQNDYSNWLNKQSDKEALISLLKKSTHLSFNVWPVTMQMNHPQFDAPECLKPL